MAKNQNTSNASPSRTGINNSSQSNNTIQAARPSKSTNNNDTAFNFDSSNSGWTTKTNKRNLSTSSNQSSSGLSPNLNVNKNKKKLFVTANRFSVLTPNVSDNAPPNNSTEENPNIIIDQIDQIKPPPPIFVKGIINFSDLCTSLIELIGVDNFYCKSSSECLKIQTANPGSYRALIHFLKTEEAQFHTYQLKEDKPTRVVIRNLHPSTSTDEIKSELELRLFEVRKVTNVLHKTTKRPLPLFFIDLEPTDYSNDIFKLSSFLHTKIKVEEPYKAKIISQCLNCQEYGHTRTYCGYPPRCVRCSANHASSECTKPRDTPAKCVLCSGDHPANYRGCTVYKELQLRKSTNTKSKFLHDTIKSNSNNLNVKSSHPLPSSTNENVPNSSYTYAQATSNQSFQSPPPPSPDITKVLTSFIDELKSLVNPLISLLTQVISSLLSQKK